MADPQYYQAPRMERLDPATRAAFEALAQEFYRRYQRPLRATDTYRSYDEQVELKKRKPFHAATPGHSKHGEGLAIDIDERDVPYVAPLLQSFGFHRPLLQSKGETWHIELANRGGGSNMQPGVQGIIVNGQLMSLDDAIRAKQGAAPAQGSPQPVSPQQAITSAPQGSPNLPQQPGVAPSIQPPPPLPASFKPGDYAQDTRSQGFPNKLSPQFAARTQTDIYDPKSKTLAIGEQGKGEGMAQEQFSNEYMKRFPDAARIRSEKQYGTPFKRGVDRFSRGFLPKALYENPKLPSPEEYEKFHELPPGSNLPEYAGDIAYYASVGKALAPVAGAIGRTVAKPLPEAVTKYLASEKFIPHTARTFAETLPQQWAKEGEIDVSPGGLATGAGGWVAGSAALKGAGKALGWAGKKIGARSATKAAETPVAEAATATPKTPDLGATTNANLSSLNDELALKAVLGGKVEGIPAAVPVAEQPIPRVPPMRTAGASTQSPAFNPQEAISKAPAGRQPRFRNANIVPLAKPPSTPEEIQALLMKLKNGLSPTGERFPRAKKVTPLTPPEAN